jgi:MSHA pilin protein MshA
MKNNKGFTLIELVIVIVILGILAAVAAPKFMNLQREAKVSVVKGLEGAVKTSMQLVRAKWLVLDNQSIDTVSVDGFDNISVYSLTNPSASAYYYNMHGYPYLSLDGLPKAVDYDSDKFEVTASDNNWVRFAYSGTSSNVLNTDNNTGCGIYCARFTVNVTGVGNRGQIRCYANTGGCN